ncbi:hypothetical protein M2390_002246 [Mycetocola sp. BIGb0189]|uniref:hypothetical protein n=1 Tax=Mycetocola sp. BIGb0189 TaxID=2940604 RepID=UPI002167B933|nr:hypothetical protein [Mycetocola sp. BIGb0189]MCS4277052.1 hypothetical protein [Mycetocola sp. BIGb0189]
MSASSPSPLEHAHRSWWRRVLSQPLIWAALCLALTLPWTLNERGMDAAPFILTLIGGWLLGVAFVNLTLRMQPVRRGVIVHVGVAAVATTAMIVGVEGGGAFIRALPEAFRGPVFMGQLALIPAICWTLLGLLSRVTLLARRPARSPRTAPEWVEDRTGVAVTFHAVPMRLRALYGWGIALAVLVAVVISIPIVNDAVPRWANQSPMVFLAAAAIVALPPYLVFRAVCAHRTRSVVLRFTPRGLTLTEDGVSVQIPLSRVTRLVWSVSGETARVEIQAPGANRSLLVSVARHGRGTLAQLPPLRARTASWLAEAGLVPVEPAGSRAKRAPARVFERVFE